MLGYYLWLIPCFQVALISAAAEESEHVHIKVHVPDITRKHIHKHRVHQYQHHKHQHPILQQFHYPGKRPLHATVATSTHSSAPYEFDFFGLGGDAGSGGYVNSAKSLMPEEMMGAMGGTMDSYGPVLFNNDIATPPVSTQQQQHPVMSKQLMRQLFTPEMMSVLTGKEEDTSHELNDVNGHLTGMDVSSTSSSSSDMNSRPTAMESNDLLSEYLQQFNSKQQAQISSPKFHTASSSNKRKKYGYDGRGQQKEPKDDEGQPQFQAYYSANIEEYLTPQQRKQQIRKSPYQYYQNHQHQQHHQNYNPLQWGYDEDDVDEFETAEDISSSTSDSNEDMTTAFNKEQPISYLDMFGEYATPLTSTSTANQHGLSYQQQTTEPTYSNDWRQYHHQTQYHQHQRPEVHKQQKQRYKQKQKSQQTQFVLPSTTLRLTTTSSSPSSAASAALASASTSPISSGFTSGSYTSTGTLPWTLPYEFVQQSQREQQQQLETQQYQHKQHKQQPKLSSYKKRKNRNKRKRTRIIVE